MAERPLFAVTLLRFTFLPAYAKNYLVACWDAPICVVLAGTACAGVFYCSAFVLIGTSAKSLVEAVDDEGESSGLLAYAPAVVGLLFTVLAAVLVNREARKKVAELQFGRAGDAAAAVQNPVRLRHGDEGGDGAKDGAALALSPSSPTSPRPLLSASSSRGAGEDGRGKATPLGFAQPSPG
jgi:uncharacterized integral membrane protein